jgi:hypothetical protein
MTLFSTELPFTDRQMPWTKNTGRHAGQCLHRRREALLVDLIEAARVCHDGKVGAAADPIDFVDWLVTPVREVSGSRSCKMPTCREADHTNPSRIDIPIRGLAADQTDCALSIFQRPERGDTLDDARAFTAKCKFFQQEPLYRISSYPILCYVTNRSGMCPHSSDSLTLAMSQG